VSAPAIEMRGIVKRFGAVVANDSVDLTVEKGTIHGLVGENGAGKSTLMSILDGFYAADAGSIAIDGKPVTIGDTRDAIRCGVGMVHQHFMLVDAFTVLENVVLGVEGGAFTAKGEAKARAAMRGLAEDYGLDVDPDARVADLAVGELQRVEIVKALVRGAEILVLDEPTAVLTPREAERLFAMLRRLREEGRTVVLVTHKLKEIMAITDAVSVMRRGALVATRRTAETNPEELAELMVGRRVAFAVDKAPARPGPAALEVRDLAVADAQGARRLDGVSFDVRAGEIVGVAGVSGNGQSELLEAIAGLRRPSAGSIRVAGEALALGARRPRALGVRHVPEDRHRMGLVTAFEAAESAMLGYEREARYGAGYLFDRRRILADCGAKMEAFDVRPLAPTLRTALFSGGNQQKIVLAREMARDPVLLLVGQPTRGVDIGAIEFIHRRLIALRDEGKAILLVSVEIDEILALADRILVMCAGRITGERRPEATDERDLGLLMAGVTERAA
jgi:simple sugar transport system ATP-binding protein